MTTAMFDRSHRIAEKGLMEYRPFGLHADGQTIRDVSGVVIRANLEFLEECVRDARGLEAGAQAVRDLIRLLNERIPDPTYHVTDTFLRNEWNSYSYEFVSFLDCFCTDLSGKPDFQYHLARTKFVSPVILSLALPFSTAQIFGLWPYYGDKFAPGLHFSSVEVGDRRAVLRVEFHEHINRQIGPYRQSCASHLCQAVKGTLVSTPERVHGLTPANVIDRQCMANGDACCEYEVSWQFQKEWPWLSIVAGSAAAFGVALALHASPMAVSWLAAIGLALPFGLLPWLLLDNAALRQDLVTARQVIADQIASVESRHEELRNAYLTQQQGTAVLRQKVAQLTLLHQTSLLVSSTLDREQLVESVLHHIKYDLNYDRVLLTFYDRTRQVGHDVRVLGVSEEVARFARSLVTSIADPNTIEGQLSRDARPILVQDIETVMDRLAPPHRELVRLTNTKSVLMVPLKVQSRILGSITVTRCTEHPLTDEDTELMQTVAGQVAMALDNTQAYGEIEQLNEGLEAKVQARTTELAQANERLQEMDRLKSQFVAHVSHELRTPLTVITGFADNMLEGVTGTLSGKQAQYLLRIKASGLRLTRMIANLLQRARIEEGKDAHTPCAVALRAVVQDTIDQLRPLAAAKQQQLDVVDRFSARDVWADPDSLTRILTNLVENAIKYTPVEGTIRVTLEGEGSNQAAVSVSDTGEGIPADELPRLFDPFYRAQRPRAAGKKDGLGLGLSIVRHLVEQNGGTITVQSQQGIGSTFRLTIPIHRPPSASAQEAPHRAARRILLVNDDPDIRQLLSDRLTADGFAVSLASNGETALQQLEGEPFTGVIVDLGLPNVDGLTVLRAVRERQKTLPVIMITAGTAEEQGLHALRLGAQAYLLKPLDTQEFQRVVTRWFRGELSQV